VDWVAKFDAPSDDGAACYRSMRNWGGRYKCSNTDKYCGGKWDADVKKCCPGLCESKSSIFLPEMGRVTWSGAGPLGSGSPRFGNAASQPALVFSNKQHTLTLNWEYPLAEMTLLYSDADFNERITFSTNGGGSTFEMALLGPTDSWSPPNVLSGSGNDRNDDPNDYSKIIIRDPSGFTQLNLIHGNIPQRGVNAILQLRAKPLPNADFGGGCPRPTTTKATTTTTTTRPPQCPEVAVDWKGAGFKAPSDNGAACFNSMRAWGSRYKCSNTDKYCGGKWHNDIEKCCPGICEAKAPTNVFIPELGKVTWDGKGPLGNGKPHFGTAASQPALVFSNKQHTLTLNWENPMTEMTILYSDADFNERITFSTNGAGSTFEMALLGPTDSWSPPNVLSGSGNDRNEDPKDYSKIVIYDPSGFTQLKMQHGNIPQRGVNAILQLKAKPMAVGGGCPTTTPTTTTTTTTTTRAPQCAEVAVDWKGNYSPPKDDGAACYRSMRNWGSRYKCSNTEKYCGGRWNNDAEKCCPGMCTSQSPSSVFIPELGKITWSGKGPLGNGSPHFGNAASQPALVFSNKQHTLTLNWENPMTEMTVLYSDADFNERITFSTNGSGSQFEMAKLGPTDSWSPPNVLSGSGNDRNEDPNDYSKIIIYDPAGFTQLKMVHDNIPQRGVNAILQLKARPKNNCQAR